MKTSKEPSETSKTAKNTQMGHFYRSLDTLFKVMGRLKLFLTSHMAWYLMEPIRVNEDIEVLKSSLSLIGSIRYSKIALKKVR